MPRNSFSGTVEFLSEACATSGSEDSVKNLEGSGLGEKVPQPASDRPTTAILNIKLIERFISPPASPVYRRSETWGCVERSLTAGAGIALRRRLLEGFCQARKR